jgi:arylsulfatase A-like enzyme
MSGRKLAVIVLVLAVAGLVTALKLRSWAPRGDGAASNVLLISVDALRADRLGYAGHVRETSENIDRLANEGVVFDRAYSQSGWTLPSAATMLTGQYPKDHGATDLHRSMDPSVPTLAGILSDEGYDTRGFVSHILLTPTYGLDRGFGAYDCSVLNVGHPHLVATAEQLTDLAIEAVRDIREPFFIWMHYFDPHFAYLPHSEWAFGSTDVDRYDDEIAHVDHHIGRLLRELRARGLYDRTIVVFTADHGEEFGDHGGRYHMTQYEEVLRVPLVIRAPRLRHRLDHTIAEQIDLVPTILAMLGVEHEEDWQGKDLLADTAFDGPVFIERDRPPPYRQRAVIEGDHKLRVVELVDVTGLPEESRTSPVEVTNVDHGTYLYDLSEDPEERRNLYTSEGVEAARLVDLIAGYCSSGTGAGLTVTVDEELEAKLRSLGYLH